MSFTVIDLPREFATIAGVPLYWYGLLVALGMWLSLRRLAVLTATGPVVLSAKQIDRLGLLLMVGAIAGGRLGEMLLYSPGAFFTSPWIALDIRSGGLSSHGGMIGVLLAIGWFSRRDNVRFTALLDAVALCAPIGLAFGRLGNFVNAELHGAMTDVAWAVIRPSVDMLPRHPVQLYQALAEGPVLALVLVHRRCSAPGVVAGTFCLAYAGLRFFTEAFREVDPLTLGLHAGLTNGQMYSLVLAVIGLIVLAMSRRPWAPSAVL